VGQVQGILGFVRQQKNTQETSAVGRTVGRGIAMNRGGEKYQGGMFQSGCLNVK
jgi:hypothetical protein